jgi:nucleoside-diphosphate-sugar epimerase
MKIFITGSTGFIGQNLVQYYKDHEIFKHDRGMDVSDNLEYFKPNVIINVNILSLSFALSILLHIILVISFIYIYGKYANRLAILLS